MSSVQNTLLLFLTFLTTIIIAKTVSDSLDDRVLKLGMQCGNKRERCVPHAFCNTTCQCKDGRVPKKDGSCGRTFYETCLNATHCSDKLECNSNRCLCPNPTFQTADYGTDNCQSLVGFSCGNDTHCYDASVCKKQKDGTKKCECKTGFVVNDLYFCEKAHGENCDNRDFPCDTMAGLKCVNGKCRCVNKVQVYEPGRRQCSTPFGYPCRIVQECVTNTTCVFPDKNLPVGRCQKLT